MSLQIKDPKSSTPQPSQDGHITRPKNAPRKLFEPSIVKRASIDSLRKLDPRMVAKNPVMFVVEIGSVVTSYFFIKLLFKHDAETWFVGQVSLWLWFTVIFANFAEAMAEGRGKAQANALRQSRTKTVAKLLRNSPERL